MALIYGLAVSQLSGILCFDILGFAGCTAVGVLCCIFLSLDRSRRHLEVGSADCGGKTKSEMCLLFHSVKVRFTSDLCRSFVKYKSWLLRRPCVLDKEFGQVVLEYLANKPSRFQHPSICFWCCIFRNFWIPLFSIEHIIL